MSPKNRIKLAWKAFIQLGPNQVGLYALYQVGKRTGYYKHLLSSKLKKLQGITDWSQCSLQPCLSDIPDPLVLSNIIDTHVDQLYQEADEIALGNVRLFGGPSLPLELIPPIPLEYWTSYESGSDIYHQLDIKFIWEPGRFGWACKLAMAYHLSNNEQYAEAFWKYTEQFISSNPPYLGPHWSSSQEVAIRLVALAFAIQIFSKSIHTTQERLQGIAKTIAEHAERIPPTLIYARSQNNNHLITEALALYTASAIMPSYPHSARWHKMGWKWLINAFQTQISSDGSYTQHSTNYHRLLLQAALWANAVRATSFRKESFPQGVQTRLEAATHWLWNLVDPSTGSVPNMGHNDGAYILPLSVCRHQDYRPVIHAAACTFLQQKLTPSGPWDDMTAWLGLETGLCQNVFPLNFSHQPVAPDEPVQQSPHIIINRRNDSWATLRVAKFQTRPAHADQLHLDLWWRGHNIALDPGTYLYNAPAPWENSLTSALVHNTVVVDDQDFMQKAGRFLYLDWAQARIVESHSLPQGGYESLTAEHNGYRKIGVFHSRKVAVRDDGQWEIIDHIKGIPDRSHTARLHWLLPDWEYDILDASKNNHPEYEIQIKSPDGWIKLKVGIEITNREDSLKPALSFQVARAGELLYGVGSVLPISGWTSPTYGEKIPALSCILEITQLLPIKFNSIWILNGES